MLLLLAKGGLQGAELTYRDRRLIYVPQDVNAKALADKGYITDEGYILLTSGDTVCPS